MRKKYIWETPERVIIRACVCVFLVEKVHSILFYVSCEMNMLIFWLLWCIVFIFAVVAGKKEMFHLGGVKYILQWVKVFFFFFQFERATGPRPCIILWRGVISFSMFFWLYGEIYDGMVKGQMLNFYFTYSKVFNF